MARATYVYRPKHRLASQYGMIDVRDLGYEPETPKTLPVLIDRHYWGVKATDGTDIGTRARHREYMKQRNLTTADDYDKPGGEWDRAAKERAQRQQGIFPDARERRQELGRIAYEVEKKNARRR